jgi:hypothetical protein
MLAGFVQIAEHALPVLQESPGCFARYGPAHWTIHRIGDWLRQGCHVGGAVDHVGLAHSQVECLLNDDGANGEGASGFWHDVQWQQ